jgi:hypothetical protein
LRKRDNQSGPHPQSLWGLLYRPLAAFQDSAQEAYFKSISDFGKKGKGTHFPPVVDAWMQAINMNATSLPLRGAEGGNEQQAVLGAFFAPVFMLLL